MTPVSSKPPSHDEIAVYHDPAPAEMTGTNQEKLTALGISGAVNVGIALSPFVVPTVLERLSRPRMG